jgi:hypothetical protein
MSSVLLVATRKDGKKGGREEGRTGRREDGKKGGREEGRTGRIERGGHHPLSTIYDPPNPLNGR